MHQLWFFFGIIHACIMLDHDYEECSTSRKPLTLSSSRWLIGQCWVSSHFILVRPYWTRVKVNKKILVALFLLTRSQKEFCLYGTRKDEKMHQRRSICEVRQKVWKVTSSSFFLVSPHIFCLGVIISFLALLLSERGGRIMSLRIFKVSGNSKSLLWTWPLFSLEKNFLCIVNNSGGTEKN